MGSESINDDSKTRVIENGKLPSDIGTDHSYYREISWLHLITFLVGHLAGLYGLYLCYFANTLTLIWAFVTGFLSLISVTMGAHRLYSHRAFKVTSSVRFILMILQATAGQTSMYSWAKIHRQHHKYSDTDADPHNATKGFFFSHIGWLIRKKHPQVRAKQKQIDLSDLEADWMLMYQKKYYKPIYLVFSVIIPTVVPMYFWDETFANAFLICYVLRYMITLNDILLVNSAAHLYGNKPYDKFILPVQSKLVAFAAVGEGWHNYHHSFPWDYRSAELGTRYNPTTFVIELLAYFNLVYDLRTTPYELVKSRTLRTGDGTHRIIKHEMSGKSEKVEENEAKTQKIR